MGHGYTRQDDHMRSDALAPAWFKFGQTFQDGQNINEVFPGSPLDFEVYNLKTGPVDSNGQLIQGLQSDTRMLIRFRDGMPVKLGEVSSTYEICQNSIMLDVLAPYTDQLQLKCMGALDNGARSFLTMYDPSAETSSVVKGESPIRPFFILIWDHTGQRSVQIICVTFRPDCANMLAVAQSEALSTGDRLAFRHSKNINTKILSASEIIGLRLNGYRETLSQCQALAGVMADHRDLGLYVNRVINPSFDASKERGTKADGSEKRVRTDKIIERIAELEETGRGINIAGIKGTWYGRFLAMSEYITHERGNSLTTDESRFETNLFNGGKDMLTRSLETALVMAR